MEEKMKRERYELLCKQVESLAAGETNVVGVLANVSAAMKTMFPEEFFWVGFYIVASPPALPCRRELSKWEILLHISLLIQIFIIY